jgi:hypothetical protein
MKKHSTLLLALSLTALGCQLRPRVIEAGKVVAAQDTARIESPTLMKQDTTKNAMGGHETCLGPKIVQGKLYHTKGRLGNVGDFLLSGSFLTGGSSSDWKPEFEALVGKKVEIKGVHYKYYCGPIEQCLEGGVMNWLREIEYLKPLE